MEEKKAKILLCEDDQNLGMVLKNYLELNDYDVVLERDGRLGLAAFQREKFDLLPAGCYDAEYGWLYTCGRDP
jgi:CheY-like chemotaxis protein